MKKFFPLFSFLISFCIQLGIVFLSHVYIIYLLLFFWVIVFLPTVSFLYSKKYLRGDKQCIAYTAAHSFLLVFSYLMLHVTEKDAYLAAVFLFVWCELWALLGLIEKQKILIGLANPRKT